MSFRSSICLEKLLTSSSGESAESRFRKPPTTSLPMELSPATVPLTKAARLVSSASACFAVPLSPLRRPTSRFPTSRDSSSLEQPWGNCLTLSHSRLLP